MKRDCAQIKLPSGKTVTIHLWEEIRTIWLSGDGKREWYTSDFQELYSKSALFNIPGNVLDKRTITDM